MDAWVNVRAIMKRELGGYFTSPVAYVFLVIFLLMTGFFTFTVGNFFERGEASLVSFFTWHPWLYLFLVPAAGMRLWSEERRLGTLELLLTMPITAWQAIVGKFIACWALSQDSAAYLGASACSAASSWKARRARCFYFSAFFSASALSVRSQVNSGSVRPKCPNAAVLV